jgi:transposase
MEDRPRRYPSDTSDEQWAVIEPLLPPVRMGGRPENILAGRSWTRSCMWCGAGCSWRQLPADFPPWQTVYWYFNHWEQARVTEKILPVVRAQLRVQEGRNPEPSAGLIDSQSVKGADTVGQESRGYDAGKKINGRKRFIVTDTLGLLLVVVVLSASIQDRDGAKSVLLESYLRTPVRFVFADGGFAGRLIDWATQILRTTVNIVRKPADQRGFAVIPRRWAVERTFAWMNAHRGLARDYERDPAVSGAMIRWAAINTITAASPAAAPQLANNGARSDPPVDLLKHALSLIFNLVRPGRWRCVRVFGVSSGHGTATA